MRILILILALIGAAGVAFYLYAASPQMAASTERQLEKDCAQAEPDQTCIVRMQAMGHVWAGHGDLHRAERWYRQAADHGDIVAMFHLGWIYEQYAEDSIHAAAAAATPATDRSKIPEGLVANRDRAREWYRRAADKGFAPAMNNLAETYEGSFDEQNRAEGMRWLTTAARAGNPIARWNLALLYDSGRAGRRDEKEMRNWSKWDAKNDVDSRDLAWPTLERTLLQGGPPPSAKLADLRAAAKSQTSVELDIRPVRSDTWNRTTTPLKPDPSIPTFRQLSEQTANGAARRDR